MSNRPSRATPRASCSCASAAASPKSSWAAGRQGAVISGSLCLSRRPPRPSRRRHRSSRAAHGANVLERIARARRLHAGARARARQRRDPRNVRRDGPHRRSPGDVGTHDGAWAAFDAQGIAPAHDRLRFLGRAITPTSAPRRFHARFFVADGDAREGEHRQQRRARRARLVSARRSAEPSRDRRDAVHPDETRRRRTRPRRATRRSSATAATARSPRQRSEADG